MDKVRVLHLLWAGRAGGAENFVKDIVLYSDGSRFEHRVCFLSSGGIVAEAISRSGCKIETMGMTSGLDFAGIIKLVSLLRDFNPQIVKVHCRTYCVNALLCFLGVKNKIYFEHGGGLIGHNSWREILFYWIFGRTFRLVLANSNRVRRFLITRCGLPETKVKTCYIGINCDLFDMRGNKGVVKKELSVPFACRVVGTIGRLVQAKGMDDFLLVASRIRQTLKDVTFVIIGDGPEKDALIHLASNLNLNVIFLGERNDVARLLCSFDLFVFTSRWESFGLVILEAMAARVPVVGFPVDGAKEIFEKGGLESLLTKERNVDELFALAYKLLTCSEIESEQITKKEHKNIKDHFDIVNTIRMLSDEYVALLTKTKV